jgi:preprotein translocase subunit SecG
MFYGILIAVHIIVCVFLIIVVLIQAGRGGGLAESFSGAESIFGTKTNALLTRTTTFFAVLFFITCLSLTILSKQRSASIIKGAVEQKPKIPAAAKPAESKEIPSEEPQSQQTQQIQPSAAPAKEKVAEMQTRPQESQKQQEAKPGN